MATVFRDVFGDGEPDVEEEPMEFAVETHVKPEDEDGVDEICDDEKEPRQKRCRLY